MSVKKWMEHAQDFVPLILDAKSQICGQFCRWEYRNTAFWHLESHKALLYELKCFARNIFLILKALSSKIKRCWNFFENPYQIIFLGWIIRGFAVACFTKISLIILNFRYIQLCVESVQERDSVFFCNKAYRKILRPYSVKEHNY